MRLTDSRRITACPVVAAALGFAAALAIALAPQSSAKAQLAVSASGYYALESQGGLNDAARVPIAVTQQSSTPAKEEITAGGGTEFFQPMDPDIGNGIYAAAGAYGYASAEYGRLRVFGSASAVAPFTYLTDNVNSPNPMDAEARIDVYAGWSDPLTITSSTLPIGTEVQIPVHFRADMYANDRDGLNNPLWGTDPMIATASFYVGIYAFRFSTNPGPGGTYWRQEYLGQNERGPIFYEWIESSDYTYTAHVGETIPWGASFSLSGFNQVTAADKTPDGTTVKDNYMDARNTSLMGLDYIPDGVTITSASGFDYTTVFGVSSAAAPEPGATVLFGIGLLLQASIALRKRRNRRQQYYVPYLTGNE